MQGSEISLDAARFQKKSLGLVQSPCLIGDQTAHVKRIKMMRIIVQNVQIQVQGCRQIPFRVNFESALERVLLQVMSP